LKQFFVAVSFMLIVFNACAQDQTESFLKRHWAFPILPQGKASASYSKLEISLNPDDCGSCHEKQYKGWLASRHSHAMGPGVMGQLLEIKPNSVGELRDCTRCHAPLAEQEVSLRKQLRGSQQTAPLHEQGLVCAACHIRKNVRYGPPPRHSPSKGRLPHDGFVISPAFEDSRFCATCHQFGKDGYALNGKPLENTYVEWQASSFAKKGQQCQFCHMPGRQHLWLGIHDVEMTRRGVTISPTVPTLRKGKFSAQLSITNSGTGHNFPSYVTPRVLVRIYQESTDRKLISGTLREKIIARQMSADMLEELMDTRLAPDEKMLLNYSVPLDKNAAVIVMQVRVEPDYYYTGLYRSLLDEQIDGKGMKLIQIALKNSLASVYELYVQRYSLAQIESQ